MRDISRNFDATVAATMRDKSQANYGIKIWPLKTLLLHTVLTKNSSVGRI